MRISHGNRRRWEAHTRMRARNRTRGIPVALHFRICVLSHDGGLGTRGERNRTTLFTHELLSVRNIAHRNQQITDAYRRRRGRKEKKNMVTTTSRCRFAVIGVAVSYESSGRRGTLHRFLQSRNMMGREGGHEIPKRRRSPG